MIWTNQVARAIDKLSCSVHGIPSLNLMEEAGLGVARLAMEIWKPGLRILIAAGPGNNGGDALVAARYLHAAGFAPQVYSVLDAGSQETEERRTQRLRWEQVGGPCLPYRSAEDFQAFSSETLIIDGLLGLGLTKPLRPGLVRNCLEALAALRARRVLAIDLPSGMQADVWQGQDVLLPATHTLSFGAPKPVHVLEPARSRCGIVRILPLPFHPEAIRSAQAQAPFQLKMDSEVLPEEGPWQALPADAHKFTRGHVLVIGGSPGKLGAPLLAAEAAMRAGVGWASVALLSNQDRPALPRFLTYEDCGCDPKKLLPFLEQRRVKALLIGPGTMQNPLTPELLAQLKELQARQGLALVFDAGALRGWSMLAKGLRFDPGRTLLTPHPGEWRAIDASHEDLGSLASLEPAWDFCDRFAVSVFYKAATPFGISSHQGRRILVNNDGSRALGKAGSGDVLAGVATAFTCAGRDASLAGNEAQRAVAKAAQKAVLHWGVDGLQPEDLLQNLGQPPKE